LHEQAKPDAKDLPAVPELDAKLLEQIEQSEANGAASTNGQSAKNQSAKKK
jgi:hypothetical protein